jgi:hypothetical protein
MAILLKRDARKIEFMATLREADPERWNPRDLLAPELPQVWTGPHVGLRIAEGFVTLRMLPAVNGRHHPLVSFWPSYCYEFEDLLAQAENRQLELTHRAQNETRILPSAHAVAIADRTIHWPMKYLGTRFPELAVAVNAVGLAHSLERDAGWVCRKRGGFADTWRQRHDRGCEIIAAGLVADRTPVF